MGPRSTRAGRAVQPCRRRKAVAPSHGSRLCPGPGTLGPGGLSRPLGVRAQSQRQEPGEPTRAVYTGPALRLSWGMGRLWQGAERPSGHPRDADPGRGSDCPAEPRAVSEAPRARSSMPRGLLTRPGGPLRYTDAGWGDHGEEAVSPCVQDARGSAVPQPASPAASRLQATATPAAPHCSHVIQEAADSPPGPSQAGVQTRSSRAGWPVEGAQAEGTAESAHTVQGTLAGARLPQPQPCAPRRPPTHSRLPHSGPGCPDTPAGTLAGLGPHCRVRPP